MDHYDALGVSKTADSEAIKKAYRSRAQKAHPDKQDGDPGAFMAIQRAYEVLSDPERRARYDAGEDTNTPESLESRALKELGMLVISTIEQLPDIESVDLIGIIREQLKGAQERQKHGEKEFVRKAQRYRKAKDRLKRKDHLAPLVETMIDAQLASLERGRAMHAEKTELIIAVLELLKGYSYRVTQQSHPTGGSPLFHLLGGR